ncbi:MAG: hypothetical protein GXO99_00555, partial [Nitrospirae bacterium]|nr:hypothetical protein [Nitrospirota bacterium]
MSKMRIYELSREIKVSNKDILKELEKMGITGKTHSSNIDGDTADRIREIFSNLAKEEKTKKAERP